LSFFEKIGRDLNRRGTLVQELSSTRDEPSRTRAKARIPHDPWDLKEPVERLEIDLLKHFDERHVVTPGMPQPD